MTTVHLFISRRKSEVRERSVWTNSIRRSALYAPPKHECLRGFGHKALLPSNNESFNQPALLIHF